MRLHSFHADNGSIRVQIEMPEDLGHSSTWRADHHEKRQARVLTRQCGPVCIANLSFLVFAAQISRTMSYCRPVSELPIGVYFGSLTSASLRVFRGSKNV